MDFIRKLTKLQGHLQDLTGEEAYLLAKSMLGREISDIKISALLTAMRIKGESVEELLGIIRALRESLKPLPPKPSHLDLSLNYDGKVKTVYILPSALVFARRCGLSMTYHWAEKVPAKMGTTLWTILEELGLTDGDLLSVAHQREFAPELYTLLPLRRELGFRTFFNVVEKFLNPFNCSYMISSLFHKPYFEKLSSLCNEIGFKRYVLVKGLEGGIEPLPDRPTFYMVSGGEVSKIDPFKLGIKLPKKIETERVLEDSVELNREVLEGRASEEYVNWACLSAGFLLTAGGLSQSPEEGFEMAKEAVG